MCWSDTGQRPISQPAKAHLQHRKLVDDLLHHRQQLSVRDHRVPGSGDDVKGTFNDLTRVQALCPQLTVHPLNAVALQVQDAVVSHIASKRQLEEKQRGDRLQG